MVGALSTAGHLMAVATTGRVEMSVQASGGYIKRSALRRTIVVSVAVLVVFATIGLVSGTSGAAQSHAKKKSKAPGTLIASEQVGAPGVNGTAYIVKYWSRSVPKNKAVEVTGEIVVPSGTPPAGGWPVVSWAHGTNGTNSSCAPSLDPVNDIPNVNNLLAQGWEVTATDYQGEGNPLLGSTGKGILPYLGRGKCRPQYDRHRPRRPTARRG